MSEFYDNLLKATDNTDDITTEKYGTITRIEDNLCSVKEEDAEIEHSNIPILDGMRCQLGDKVVIGFVDNSIYDPILIGNLTTGFYDNISSDDVKEASALNNLGLPSNSSQHQINLKVNEKINQGGGGGGGIVMVGSFRIDENGDLIATLPNGASNPYHINENGDLIYSTTVGSDN